MSEPCIDCACRAAILRTARAQDLQDWPAFADGFAEEARLVRPDGQVLQGRAAIAAAYAARPPGRLTRHLVTGTLVDPGPAGEARALSTVLLWSAERADDAGPQGRPASGAQLLGEFDDRLQLQADGRWRIVQREARFLMHR